MKALNVAEAVDAESRAKQRGWTDMSLLRCAGQRLGWSIGRFFPRKGLAVGYLGKGHNAGDVVVALGVLKDEFGWEVAVRCAFAEDDWSPLLRDVWGKADGIPLLDVAPHVEDARHPVLLLDGLTGLGLSGPLRRPLVEMVREMRDLRSRSGAVVAAVDVPSGIDPDSGRSEGVHVVADVTFQIANAKAGLLLHEAVNATGSLAVVPVKVLATEGAGDLTMISPQAMNVNLPPRAFDTHKGQAGRVALLAGSIEYPGAAILCAMGALRAGAGLVYLHVPDLVLDRIAVRCPPEIIVRGVQGAKDFFDTKADVHVLGCGLGEWAHTHRRGLIDEMLQHQAPMVIDADALNVLADKSVLEKFGENHLLTPHPGEFRRLVDETSAGASREEAVRAFVEKYPCSLLLKGARTIVGSKGKGLFVNSTGHPGMATGGQGDWLAGVIGSLIAGGLSVHDAACLGAWLAGRCAELGIWTHGHSAESLCPSDFGGWLGRAFTDWRESVR